MFSFHYRINPSIKVILTNNATVWDRINPSIKVIVTNNATVWECIVTVPNGDIVNSISGNDPVDILAAAIQSVIESGMAPGQNVIVSNCEICDAPAVVLDSLTIGGDRRILIAHCSH